MKPVLSEKLQSDIRKSILRLDKGVALDRAKILAIYNLMTESRKTFMQCEDITMVEDEVIVSKKYKQIMEATTKKDIELIMGMPKVKNIGGELAPEHKWVIPEEELMMLSKISLSMRLSPIAFERYRSLFMELFPEASNE